MVGAISHQPASVSIPPQTRQYPARLNRLHVATRHSLASSHQNVSRKSGPCRLVFFFPVRGPLRPRLEPGLKVRIQEPGTNFPPRGSVGATQRNAKPRASALQSRAEQSKAKQSRARAGLALPPQGPTPQLPRPKAPQTATGPENRVPRLGGPRPNFLQTLSFPSPRPRIGLVPPPASLAVPSLRYLSPPPPPFLVSRPVRPITIVNATPTSTCLRTYQEQAGLFSITPFAGYPVRSLFHSLETVDPRYGSSEHVCETKHSL